MDIDNGLSYLEVCMLSFCDFYRWDASEIPGNRNRQRLRGTTVSSVRYPAVEAGVEQVSAEDWTQKETAVAQDAQTEAVAGDCAVGDWIRKETAVVAWGKHSNRRRYPSND